MCQLTGSLKYLKLNHRIQTNIMETVTMRRTIIRNAKRNFNKGRNINKMNHVRPTRGGIRL